MKTHASHKMRDAYDASSFDEICENCGVTDTMRDSKNVRMLSYPCGEAGKLMPRRVIFVFGSNLKGIHGSGSAKMARYGYGAQIGVGEGLTGDSYALPTCSEPGIPLPIGQLHGHIRKFVEFAMTHPELDFLLTSVGCGIAGYDPLDINVQFRAAGDLPNNVYVQAKLARM